LAAATASSTSSGEANESVASRSPFDGLVTVYGSDEPPRRRLPLTNRWPVSSTDVDMARSRGDQLRCAA
jgi:hypothetical protein